PFESRIALAKRISAKPETSSFIKPDSKTPSPVTPQIPMKPTIHSLALAAFALSAAAVPALAQEKAKLPPPSPDASVSQNVLNTKITINYRAPGVKGREIWGKLVP